MFKAQPFLTKNQSIIWTSSTLSKLTKDFWNTVTSS